MRFRRFLPIALLGAAAACSSDSSPAAAAAAQRRQTTAQPHIPFADPVLLDSTADVLYPLPLQEAEETSGYGSSSSYGRPATYWNILFYNTRSGASHLLDTGRRLVVQAYHLPGTTEAGEASRAKPPGRFLANRLIFYSVLTTDTNRDGELTTDDPTYLFTSDKAGNNFRQISPDSLHVSSWEIQPATGLVLLQTVRDANRDRKFDDADEVIPYRYDPATGQPASRLFATAVVQQLRAAFQSKWAQKPAR